MINQTTNSLAILGTVRNGGEGLRRTLGFIERLRSRLSCSRCVIVTNDNDDETDECLASLGRGSEILQLDGLAAAVCERIERISLARNMGLMALRSGGKMSEYTLVLDLDGPNADLEPEAVLNLMTTRSTPWEGLFANQREAYYDLSALRHPEWCPDDCWVEYEQAKRRFNALRSLGVVSNKKIKEKLKKQYVHDRQYRIPPEHPWIPVQSAFGGLGLYRSAAIEGQWYGTGARNGRPTCEHVGLHRRMVAAGARLFIVPDLLNLAPSAHLGPGSGAALPSDLKLIQEVVW
jgi:hypothetical protein